MTCENSRDQWRAFTGTKGSNMYKCVKYGAEKSKEAAKKEAWQWLKDRSAELEIKFDLAL